MHCLEIPSPSVVSALLVANLALAAVGQTQVPLQHSFAADEHEGSKHAITQELSQFVMDLMESSNIPGISLGVVHTGGGDTEPDVELKSWGRMSEDGDKLSPDVSL